MFVSFRSKVNAVISLLVIFPAFLALIISTRFVTYAASPSSSPLIKLATSTLSTTLKCGGWRVIPSLNLSASQNNQNGVLANAANDIWTVGSYGDSDHSSTLIEHWDGSSWSIISSPNVGTLNTLNAVTRVPNTKQMWAVGTSSGSPTQTLIEHWDGTVWSIIPSPNVGLATNNLAGVSAVTASNVWAVGEYSDNGSYPSQTLIEHWNGSSWSVVPSPNLGSASWLNGVVESKATDIWAVGAYHLDSNGVNQSLTEHWDGSSWSTIQGSGGNDDILNAVTRVPNTNQIWAVGYDYTYTSQGYTGVPQIENWNGSSWKTLPYNTNLFGYLYSVVAISIKNIWAVGVGHDNTSGVLQTLIEHWNGTIWSVVSHPNLSSPGILDAIAQVPHTQQVIAIGNYSNSSGMQTLIETNC